MADKIELNDVAGGYNIATINANFSKLGEALNNNVLYRKNIIGAPNTMESVLDMNGHSIINVGNIVSSGDPVTDVTASDVEVSPFPGVTSTNVQTALQEINAKIGTGGGGGGTAGVLTFNNRDGNVTLTPGDVVQALGYTPASSTGGGGSTAGPSSVAALRAASSVNVTTVTTQGYYAPADGGHATYYKDSADVSSPDNGGSVIVASDGARWKLAKGLQYSAKQFGARGNSTFSFLGADDTIPLERFIVFLGLTGAKGYIPAGRYRMTRRITIPENCMLHGDGWKDVRDITGFNTRDWSQSKPFGTIIYANYTNTDTDHNTIFYVRGNSTVIRDIEFECDQTFPGGANWTTANTPYAILAQSGLYEEQGGMSLVMENIMLRNFKDGIRLQRVARGLFRAIFGQCFGNGIEVTQNGDVCRLEDIHLNWPFYSGDTNTMNYMFANANGLLLGRVDNPNLSNFFVWGGRSAITTYIDTDVINGTPVGGKTGRLQATNVGIDNIKIGLDLRDAVDMSISNFYVYNNIDQADTIGIYSHAVLGGGQIPIRMMLTNGDFQGSKAEAMRFEVPGTVQLANVVIRDYNTANGSAPGIAAYDGVKVQYVNLVNDTPSATPLTQTYGTGTIEGAGSGGGGGSGVSSFNTRTGAVVMNAADVATAMASATAVTLNAPTMYRSTGTVTPNSGSGVEMNFASGAGFIVAYNRSTSQYLPLNLDGSSVNLKSGTLTINSSGDAFFASNLYCPTPATNNTGTRVATCDYVINKIAASGGGGGGGVTSFNARTGAILLNPFDITAALTGNTSEVISTGTVIRSTGNTVPTSGVGLEMSFNNNLYSGFVIAYDRSGGNYADLNVGGYNITFKTGNGTNSASIDSYGSLLIGYPSTNSTAYRLQVNSQIYATSATIATSDKRVKKDIKPLSDGLNQVLKLKPVTYTFKDHKVHNFPKGTQVGFLAQDVESALKQTNYLGSVVAVNDDGKENLYGLAEVKLIPLLVKAIQELSDRIIQLENP